jgi:hypothetical protein
VSSMTACLSADVSFSSSLVAVSDDIVRVAAYPPVVASSALPYGCHNHHMSWWSPLLPI